MFHFKEREQMYNQEIEYYSIKAIEGMNTFMSFSGSTYDFKFEHRGKHIKMFLVRDDGDILTESRWLRKRRMARSVKELARIFGN